jgi:hypothetical protein
MEEMGDGESWVEGQMPVGALNVVVVVVVWWMILYGKKCS